MQFSIKVIIKSEKKEFRDSFQRSEWKFVEKINQTRKNIEGSIQKRKYSYQLTDQQRLLDNNKDTYHPPKHENKLIRCQQIEWRICRGNIIKFEGNV